MKNKKLFSLVIAIVFTIGAFVIPVKATDSYGADVNGERNGVSITEGDEIPDDEIPNPSLYMHRTEYEVSGPKVDIDIPDVVIDGPDTDNGGAGVPVPKPMSLSFNEHKYLDGDIAIGEDSGHTAVFETTEDADLTITGILNIKPVKEQMQDIENKIPKMSFAESIGIGEDYVFQITAALKLPDEMDYVNPTATLTGDKGSFKIVSQQLKDRQIEVILTTNKKPATYIELKEMLNNADDNLKVNISGVRFNTLAKADTNYTIYGELFGEMSASAYYKLLPPPPSPVLPMPASSVMMRAPKIPEPVIPIVPFPDDIIPQPIPVAPITFNLSWTAKQSLDGADVMNPAASNIQFTLKYKKDATPQTSMPKDPKPNDSQPDIPANMLKKAPKTGDDSNLFISEIMALIAALSIAVISIKNKTDK